ncbi:hypothetical protein F0562_020460 [Nyssa sinensis]|uniref:U6 small nuclear RNA (adenine-(43)-N(6))-methyltransferase n=1 Tax=Nyssa sinensis TaxID=561372 RepID=A0A5J5BT41_9ASTE|nr:hypothetical protein F0562_020460 [Nyssa sinensis]
MPSKKKRKRAERPTIHPRNKYSDNPPDFRLLATLYPSFEPFVFYSRDGRPKIDWTDFNATRELTRILLLHDHGLNWWIPDGQLCPTVPNRSNYINWIEDLLSSDIIARTHTDGDAVRGFDIGTGANCIYPLLGASLLGWSFVGSDVTNVALEWAERNVKNNPHISELIEIRKVENSVNTVYGEESDNGQSVDRESIIDVRKTSTFKPEPSPSSLELHSGVNKNYHGPPILVGVVKDGERFDFCMCNPPFFETMEEAGLNPKTSCGGTLEEMVCPGGELAFISRIIEDSVQLKQSFRWYTSMVGRKSNLKILMSRLREVGVTIVKTTEFVQGQTCRWGLAWSFMPPTGKKISSHVVEKTVLSFMLEGIHRQYSAIHVLQSVESFFCTSGASCKLNASSFTVDVTASNDHCDAILNNEVQNINEAVSHQYEQKTSSGSNCLHTALTEQCFRISVFQQIPGTLLVKGSLLQKESPVAGAFSPIFQRLEEFLKNKFCREKALIYGSSNPAR